MFARAKTLWVCVFFLPVLLAGVAMATPGPKELQLVERIGRGELIPTIRTPVDDFEAFGYAFVLLQEVKKLCPAQVRDTEVKMAAAWNVIYFTQYSGERVVGDRFMGIASARQSVAAAHATALVGKGGGCGGIVKLIDNLQSYLVLGTPIHAEKPIRTTLTRTQRGGDMSYRCHYDDDPKDQVTEYQDYFDLEASIYRQLSIRSRSGHIGASRNTYLRKACPAEPDPHLLTSKIIIKNEATRGPGKRGERMALQFIEIYMPEYLHRVHLSNALKEEIRRDVALFENAAVSDQEIRAQAQKLMEDEVEKRLKVGDRNARSTVIESFMSEAEYLVRAAAFKALHNREFGAEWSKEIVALYRTNRSTIKHHDRPN